MTNIKTLTASLFKPTTSLSGNEPPSVFRGENLVLRGLNGSPFFENFGGNKDLLENFDLDTAEYRLTGTCSFAANDPFITGTGTLFIAELHIGQMILIGTEIFAVQEITSNTSFLSARAPTTAAAANIGFRLPQMFEIGGKRGTMLSGNAIAFEKGHIIAVGSGKLRINGAELAGTSLIASNKPKVAFYRATTNDYAVQSLGFATVPPKPVVNVIAGGTKGMADAKHSFYISYWSATPEGTDGYSNPSEVIKLDGAAAVIKIDTAGSKTRFEFDFTTSLVGLPANASGFIVWASLSGKKQTSTSGSTVTTSTPNDTNYENGPWYKVKKIKIADLVANKFSFDYLDSDVSEEITGNNDAPPECEFIAKIEGKPLYISAYGKRRLGGENAGSNPGPSCVVSKFANPDAAPAEWSASLSHNIIGWFEGVGRWFLMTASTLDFIVSTGLLGQSFQGTSRLELPIISRPYWKTGASNRYSIILIDDTLYGFSGNKLFKSVGNGDENVQKYEFGSPVEDITRKFVGGYVYTAHDSKNNNVCFIYSASKKNEQGYWESYILPYSLFRDAWLPAIVLSSPSQDMVISGVASINERLEFLAGGRTSSGTYQTRTYRFDEPDADNPITEMSYYLIWQPSDDGAEEESKRLHSIRPVGKFTDMKIQVHGARPGGEINIADMETGSDSYSGDIVFGNTTILTRYLRKKIKVQNLGMYAIRLSGVWDGFGAKDRLDEIAIEVSVHGRPR